MSAPVDSLSYIRLDFPEIIIVEEQAIPYDDHGED